ncbi:hypothetical protein BJV74DRAFT_799047 [Russula compacta]|nr:hypothetical protein BJV74DRAFT_799047 [Russula compacta]
MHASNVALLVLAASAVSPALSAPLSVRDIGPGQDMQARSALSDLLGALHLEPPVGLTDVTPNQPAARNALTDFLGHLDPEAPVGLTDIVTPGQLAGRNALTDFLSHLDPEAPVGLTDIITPNQPAARNVLTDLLGHLDPEAPVGLTDVNPTQLATRDDVDDLINAIKNVGPVTPN